MEIMLQLTVFVESANKPVFVNLQDVWDLIFIEKPQNILGKIMIHVTMSACVVIIFFALKFLRTNNSSILFVRVKVVFCW